MSGARARHFQQGGIKVAAMDHPERRAIALLRIVERNARDVVAALRGAHAHAGWRDDGLAQPRAQAEVFEHACCVGAELDAGADFFGAGRLFKDD